MTCYMDIHMGYWLQGGRRFHGDTAVHVCSHGYMNDAAVYIPAAAKH